MRELFETLGLRENVQGRTTADRGLLLKAGAQNSLEKQPSA